MEPKFLRAEEVAQELSVSKPYAYKTHSPAQRGAEIQRLYHHFRSNQPGVFQ